jgi:ATP-dependent Clp protease ATP-binding subunit ClpA
MGARPLARKIDELVRVPLSKKILFEQVKNATVAVTVDSDKKIVFNTVTKMSAKVNDNGIIEVS